MVIGPYIVKSGYVVLVPVRKDNSIQFVHFSAQHLVPEVGAAVYNDICAVGLYQYR